MNYLSILKSGQHSNLKLGNCCTAYPGNFAVAAPYFLGIATPAAPDKQQTTLSKSVQNLLISKKQITYPTNFTYIENNLKKR